MAAGLGFKDFTTGEVLTAADVDGYLMQGIWVFASNAARDAAVTAPAEGNFAFTKDTNSLWYYDGAAWVASGATGDIEGVTAGVGISGGGTSGTVTVTNSMATAIDAKGDLIAGTGADTFARLAVGGTNGHTLQVDSSTATGLKWAAPAGGGKVLQVVNATYSTITSTTSTSFVDTDLTASITPTLNTSKILILVNQVIYIENNNTTNDVWAGHKLVRGATDIWETTNAPALYSPSGTGLQIGALMSLAYYDSPATTSSTTYKTQFRVRANSLTARAQAGNTPSSITLLEIGA